MFKFVSWADITRLLHTMEHRESNMTVPICITCCIAVILCCSIKTAFAVEGQMMSVSSCGGNNFRNRLQYFGIDFIRGDIDGNSWINAFQCSRDPIPEFYTGISKSILSVITISSIATEGGDQKPNGKPIKISDDKVAHDDDDFWFLLYVFIALYPLFFAQHLFLRCSNICSEYITR